MDKKKLIHQIYISDSDTVNFPDYISNQISKLKSIYDDYEYKLWCDNDIKKLLSNNFEPKVLEAYETIRPYAFKADLARCCILYIYGGIYFDIAISPEIKFEPDSPTIFPGIRSAEVTADCDIIENNVLIFPYIGDKFLKSAIDKLVENILSLSYGVHPLDITGPIALARLNYEDLNKGYVLQHEGYRASYYNEELIYKHKPHVFQSDLNKIGCEGTNDYALMWFSGDVYNINLSYVMITNCKRIVETKICIRSILALLRPNDELIIVGNINNLSEFKTDNVKLIDASDLANIGQVSKMRNTGINAARGNVIITTDDDILFPDNFHIKVLQNIKLNRGLFDTFNVITILPNGGRWWDRAIYFGKNNAIMVPYDHPYDNRLFYPSTLIVWKKSIALAIPFDESHLYYDPVKDNEDVKLSNDLKAAGYIIKIDLNNYVIHLDYKYGTRIDNSGNMVGIKYNGESDIISDYNTMLLVRTMIERYSK